MADTTYQLNFTGDQINNLLTRINNLDTELDNYLLKNGGDMTGAINMNGQSISGLNDPTKESQAANKGYVDASVRKAAPRNLLDNSDFRNPVNQMGQTSYNYEFYTIDRWRQTASTTMTSTISDGCITLSNTSNATYKFYQRITNVKPGKIYTFVVKLKDENIFVGSSILPESGEVKVADLGSNGFTWFSPYGNSYYNIGITVLGNCSLNIEWTALYEGIYTVETLPEYQPKGYTEELLVCRQYDQTTGEYIGLRKFGQPRNLLDNSDFQNPVNQRGQTSYNSAGYTIDRWAMIVDIGTINVVSDGLELDATGNAITFTQRLDDSLWKKMVRSGKTYTLAIDYTVLASGSNNLIMFEHLKDNTVSNGRTMDKSLGRHTFISQFTPNTTDGESCYSPFHLFCMLGNKIVLHTAALYEGSYTAETLPEYQPKGYAAELAECQRYFMRYGGSYAFIAVGNVETASLAQCIIQLPVYMRLPEASVNITPDLSKFRIKNGTIAAAISEIRISQRGYIVSLACTISSNFTPGSSCLLTTIAGNNFIELSADL